MLDFSLFLVPVDPEEFLETPLGASVCFNATSTEEVERNSLCIVHVKEYRNHTNAVVGALDFRKELYALYPHQNWKSKLYDLGDLNPGERVEDTYFALQRLVAELVKINCIPIIVGGSMDLMHALSVGYEITEQLINLCAVDERLNLGQPEDSISSKGYLSSLLLRRPCYLFNHATVGVQPNRNAPQEMALYDKLFFDVCKLGAFSSDFRLAEPHLRNADIIGMNLDSVKASERQIKEGNPNGFTLEQFCRIAKYAGISDKLSCFGVFNPQNENSYDAALVAHTLWYFMEGIEERKGDFPVGSKKDYLRFTVVMENEFKELVFYKSNKTDRWWMEVPYPSSESKKFERHHLVPCDKLDYDNAMNNELPDLWWRTYQKLG
jgi:hypothetical protein